MRKLIKAHPTARSLENSRKSPGQTSIKTSKYEKYLRKIPIPKKKKKKKN